MGRSARGWLGLVRKMERDLQKQNNKGNLVVPPRDGFGQHSLGQEVLGPRAAAFQGARAEVEKDWDGSPYAVRSTKR